MSVVRPTAHYGVSLDLDHCVHCRIIWFDRHEAIELNNQAVLDLFAIIDRNRAPTHRLAEPLSCPRCSTRMRFTHDVNRGGRISYFRCEYGHGRLTTYVQFLKEKGFVRDLQPAEIERLAAAIAQVNCSNCGAPVDLVRDPACRYCRSPISVLDTEAMNRTLVELGRGAAKPAQTIDAEKFAEALIAMHREAADRAGPAGVGGIAIDLFTAGVALVAARFL